MSKSVRHLILSGVPHLTAICTALIDEIDLAVERILGIARQGIELFQNGKLLGFQSVLARTKQIQRLAIPKKDGLLALVDDELGPHAEVLDGVLPHQRLVVPLVLNDAGKAAVLDLLDHEPLGHGVDRLMVHGAGLLSPRLVEHHHIPAVEATPAQQSCPC